MDVLNVFGVIVLALVLYYIYSNYLKAQPTMFCPACGVEDEAEKVTKGSIIIEIIAWLFFLIPGIIYSIWRSTSRHLACAYCGNDRLIPPNSPVAEKMKREIKP